MYYGIVPNHYELIPICEISMGSLDNIDEPVPSGMERICFEQCTTLSFSNPEVTLFVPLQCLKCGSEKLIPAYWGGFPYGIWWGSNRNHFKPLF